jgi:hypothetical protein
VQLAPHELSFWPVVLTHLPLLQWLSLLQKQLWPAAEHEALAVLQPPSAHENEVPVDLGQVGAPAGQVATHEYTPSTGRQIGVPPAHAVPQLPQLKTVVPSTQPPSHATRPPLHPPGPIAPPSPPSVGPAESLPMPIASVAASAVVAPSADALESTLASHPPGQSVEVYALNPESAAHAPVVTASTAVHKTPGIHRTYPV